MKKTLLLTFALGLGLCACAKKDSITIVSISPEAGTELVVGQEVNFEVTARYNLTRETGDIVLVIQKEDNATLANLLEPVKKGSGMVTLRRKVKIPDSSAVKVFIPLTPAGESQTTIVDSRSYKVAKKK